MAENKEDNTKVAIAVEEIQSVNSTSQAQEVTNFVDESSEIKESVLADKSLSSCPYPIETIKSFLQRPYVVENFVWTSSQPRGKCLARLNFPLALLQKEPLWSKLANFTFLRAGIHLAIRLNGTPYHYGKLLAVWRPLCNFTSGSTDTKGESLLPGSYDNIYTLSGNPHILISPNTNRVFEMDIAYNMPVDWIDLQLMSTLSTASKFYSNRYTSLGSFDIWVFNPLMCGSTSAVPNVGVTVYANFTNVELGGYTTSQYVLRPIYPNLFSQDLLPSGKTFQTITPRAQGLSEIFTSVKKALPFSKTTEISQEQSIKVVPMPPNLSCSDSVLPGIKLSLSNFNEFHGAGFLTSANRWEDQIKIPSLLESLTLTSSMVAGTDLLYIPVHPLWFNTIQYAGKTAWLPTRLAMLVLPFALWRGTITYHFSVVCSSFHSFRLGIAWSPDCFGIAGSFDINSMVNKIVDIQGETTFEITVPMHASRSFLSTQMSSLGCNGTLFLRLVNPLSYPDTQIPNVFVNIWVSSSDIEVAKIEGASIKDANFKYPQLYFRDRSSTTADTCVRAQAKNEDPRSQVSQDILMSANLPSPRVLVLQGEKISTLLDITSKPSYLGVLDTTHDFYYVPGSLLDPDRNSCPLILSLLQWYAVLHAGTVGPVGFTIPNVSTDHSLLAWGEITNFEFRNIYIDVDTKQTSTQFMRLLSNQNLMFFPSYDNSQKQVALPWYSTCYYRPFSTFNSSVTSAFSNFHSLGMRLFGDSGETPIFEYTLDGFQYLMPIGAPILVPTDAIPTWTAREIPQSGRAEADSGSSKRAINPKIIPVRPQK